MAISVGDIYFTSNFTDLQGTGAESFSFVATTDIDPGEVITFHSPEDNTPPFGVGDTSFTFTVGPSGLSAYDRVTIIEGDAPNNDTFTLANDPSGGTVSGATGNGWSMSDNDAIIAGQGGQVLAAINNDGDWDEFLATTGLSTTDLDAFVSSNPGLASPAAENLSGGVDPADNGMFTGTDITTQGNNPAFWGFTDDPVSHTSPTIGTTTYTTQDADINCFAAGTMILTQSGEVAVEDLRAGDMITTADGAEVAVLWLAHQTLVPAHGVPEKREPVLISAGALGCGLPNADLIVTADHGVVIDGLLINASALVNEANIRFVPASELPTQMTYYHIETAAHEVVLANGAPTESFYDAAGRSGFDNFPDYLAMYGAERIIPEMQRMRISSRRLLPDAIKTRLNITHAQYGLDVALRA